MLRKFRQAWGHVALWSLGSWLTVLPAAMAQSSPGICATDLAPAITAVTQRPSFQQARWGIVVQTVADRHPLYALDAEKWFIPASNAKLLTSAAVLHALGPEYRIRTSVEQIIDPTDPQAVILQIVGRGDPSLTDAELDDLAQQVAAQGITQIDQLIGIEGYFRGEAIHPTWEWEDIQAGYGAAVNSLIMNHNWIGFSLIPQGVGQPLALQWEDPGDASQWRVNNQSVTGPSDAPEFVAVGRTPSHEPAAAIDLRESQEYGQISVQGQLRVGSASEPVAISVPDPAQRFLRHWYRSLVAQGLTVDPQGLIRDVHSPAATEVAALESPPLAELIHTLNQESDNLYAEALLRTLGVVADPTADSSLEAGLTALDAHLTQLGVDADGYQLVDGSGLSRHNSVSPLAIVQTLQGMAQSEQALTYRTSLSVAGRSGTLSNRFQGTEVAGRLEGKTGALSGAVALSGYLQPIDYPTLAFSIMVNQTDLSLGQIQAPMDEIVNLLVRLRQC